MFPEVPLHVKQQHVFDKHHPFNRTAKLSKKHNLARIRSQRYD